MNFLNNFVNESCGAIVIYEITMMSGLAHDAITMENVIASNVMVILFEFDYNQIEHDYDNDLLRSSCDDDENNGD